MAWYLYKIPTKGRNDTFDHHYAMVVEAGGSCLCVPSFTAGKDAVEESIKGLEKIGLYRYQCSVDLDNAKVVKFYNGQTGHLSTWLVARREILAASDIAKLKPSGEILDAGILAVMECYLEYNKWNAQSAKLVRAVERASSDLRSSLTPPP